ncbi:zf-ZPR1-domain-containing protein [Tilletiaria anomala UBC 951]|uniref:Zf-ZPR1-domain-containing protein n=1 Tax=Tilletiaria anomala (strain ATCC 24038 / CBS 436.72 / UBC 951) TaxID=1037660 RepID=A0A066VK51_TILAU|nr:zf-ZPR1-domain-containing protein [Tilletiaria anomala UBC 951]KDN38945.1 zf-ZPR1-domain-containing protein [Tilletiaria anomala UBC 951]
MSAQNAPDPFFRPIGDVVEDSGSGSGVRQADGQDASMRSQQQERALGSSEQQAGSGGGSEAEPKMVEEIESLCMRCHENGTTRLLLTYIPYFKEVIIASFQCDHCGERNNEIQSAGEIQEKGVIYTVHVTQPGDLDRQLVKSSFATMSIPELAIEIPAKRGQLTTLEGVISDTLRDLELDQPLRKHMDPPAYKKIEELCKRMRVIIGEAEPSHAEIQPGADVGSSGAAGTKSHGPVGAVPSSISDPNRTFLPFSLRLDDPSGNSFIEFLGEVRGRGVNDNKWSKREYPRTKKQNELLGLSAGESASDGDAAMQTDGDAPEAVTGFSKTAGETEHENEEIYAFPGTCSSCTAPLQTLMKKVNIPYFKDILIMSTNCDRCGYRDNEVKSGGAISETGRKLALTVNDAEDLSRDVLKSETAGLEIPEIDLHLAPGTLGGRFTTLEGLLQQVYDELSDKVMASGDAARLDDRSAFETFLGKLKGVMSASNVPFTVILDDPLSNSYIQNPYAPDEDEQIIVDVYKRSWEQDEELGLNDIKVENYSEESKQWAAQAAAAAGTTRKAAESGNVPGNEAGEAIKKPRVEAQMQGQ